MLTIGTLGLVENAQAQGASQPDFEVSGFAQLGYFGVTGGGGDFYGLAYLSTTVPFGAASSAFSGPGWGLELVFFGYMEQGDFLQILMPGIYADLGNGSRLTFGLPQTALARYAFETPADRFGSLGLELIAFQNGQIGLFQLLSNIYAPGLRYDYQSGNLSLSAAAHVIASPNVAQVSFGGQYDMGNWRVTGGLAATYAKSTIDFTGFVGATGNSGAFDYGARATWFGGSPLLEVFAGYQLDDAWKVTGFGLSADGDTSIGAEVQFEFGTGGYARAGILGSAGDTIINVSFGKEF